MLTNLWRRFTGLVSLLWREVAKFGTVGAAAFVVDSAVFLWMMSGPLEGSNVKAKIVAGVVATLFSWVANRFWTFRHRRQNNVVRELVMFLIMNAIGLGIQAGCVFIAQYGMGLTDRTSLFIAGNVVGLFFGTVFRYFAYRFWVFREELDTEPGYERDIAVITGQMPYVTQQPEDVPAATAENPHAVERDPSRATANRPQRPAA
ncbi:putative membrane protein, GtrA-like family [Micrococcus lylae]|uniref:GtrA family protein n=1 Tax=Micrococcus lylae TaxID=1273 RepID=A0A1R4JSA8_9MICC|nr:MULTISPECIES: GtrA family protein [Micrococcus]MCT2006359.1 GtrA family protein [Micrococcus lylae]MCT2070312.1 GtrA family protein [Micrococcus lylae]TFI01170.1 GtrA family protein [Micrococcus lylae]WIK82335.1 GtrA family protein [Micrococcus lylae]SJN35131.1 putative membrane protein, GtrA-like family [Micrococcus lylae]